ncbi:MAG: penicillin-binding transpeptidase domain-containing protein [Bryobacteraceae bacterium]
MNPLLIAVAFLQFDVESGAVTKRNWPQEDQPVAIGSLAKPFIALAYAEGHHYTYPRLTCNPKQCWLPRGHGALGVEDAIAQSCNVYFDTLRKQVRHELIESTVRRFGLQNSDRAKPEEILRAYVELQRRAVEPGVAPILSGMRRAAQKGTAKLLDRDALAKTGTAACAHTPKAPGDGFAIVLSPAAAPKTAIIVRIHGRPGSHAAREAAALLR